VARQLPPGQPGGTETAAPVALNRATDNSAMSSTTGRSGITAASALPPAQPTRPPNRCNSRLR